MNQNGKGLQPKIIGEGVILACATGVGYATSYFYEIGYLTTFGVSYQAARVSPETTIIAGLAYLSLALVVLMSRQRLLRGLYNFYDVKIVRNETINEALKIVSLMIIGFIFIAPFITYHDRWYVSFSIAISLLIVEFSIKVFIGKRKVNGIKQKLAAVVNSRYDTDRSESASVVAVVGIIGLALACILNAAGIGKIVAKVETTQQITNDNYVVARRYGDDLILAKYDFKAKTYTGQYKYQKISEEPVEFKVINISASK